MINERLSSRFAAVKKIVDELDYAGLLEADGAADEYDGESLLLCLAANPALGKDANALLVGFVFSYLFNDPKPSKAWCYLCAERICAEVAPHKDDPADPVTAVQSIIKQFGLEELMAQMEGSLAQS